jgi:amidase
MNSHDAVDEAMEKIATIDREGYQLNSVLAISETAFDEALQYDSGQKNLPLAGLPILIKDNIEAVGLPATAGSLALTDAPVLQDSTIARRLREAGAVIIGATNLSEWANIRSTKSTSGWSALGGLTANPWKHAHSAGGSSSGSGAAVAAGLTQWAIGSETDGSIICPASLNGCVGIKPTVGSIPRDGMVPISASQDSPGPMAQTVAQAALLLDVLTDKNQFLKAATTQEKLRIGVVPQWLSSQSDVAAIYETSLKQLEKQGATLIEVNLEPPTDSDYEDELLVLLYELAAGLQEYLGKRPGTRLKNLREIVDFNNFNSEHELQHFGQELFDKALEFEGLNSEYQQARHRNLIWAEKTLNKGLADVDVLIGCTYGPAWKSSLVDGDNFSDATWITSAPSLAGTPIGTIPMGTTSNLPVGLGFVSARNQEVKLISAMAIGERALELGVLRPSFIK